ncbi:MAG: hypothetical protein AAB432_01070 [Patescibacteria group bacterium]
MRKRTIFKNLVIGSLITLIIFVGGFFPLRSQADLIDVPYLTEIAAATGATAASTAADATSNSTGWIAQIAEFAYKTFLATLKRRILDTLIDQTTAWIRGDSTGQPLYTQNFGKVVQDAAQAAVGDTLQEIGLAQLCRPLDRFKLQIALQQPTFSRQISCTLDQVVDNVDNFFSNFENGGWIAYQELLKPQNNDIGRFLLTYDELLSKQGKQAEAQRQEAQASQGTISIKRCLQWTREWNDGLTIQRDVLPLNGSGSASQIPWDDAYNSLNNPPPTNPAQEGPWICTNDQITTPGTFVGESLKQTVGSDFSYIINAQDIADVAGAVLDAMINRVIKEGVKGFSSPTLSKTQTSLSRSYTSDDLGRLPNSLRLASTTIDQVKQNSLDQSKSVYLNPINSAIDSLNRASGTLYLASSTNEIILSDLQNLISCKTQKGLDATLAKSQFETATTTNRLAIRAKLDAVQLLSNRMNSYKDAVNNAKNLADLNIIDTKTITTAKTTADNYSSDANNFFSQIQLMKTDVENNLNTCQN